jgi:hypothetical protein
VRGAQVRQYLASRPLKCIKASRGLPQDVLEPVEQELCMLVRISTGNGCNIDADATAVVCLNFRAGLIVNINASLSIDIIRPNTIYYIILSSHCNDTVFLIE